MPHFGDVGEINGCVWGRYGGVCVTCGNQFIG